MNFSFTPSIEKAPKVPDSVQVIELLRNDPRSQEAVESMKSYTDKLFKDFEGEFPGYEVSIRVYIEMAKVYHKAGYTEYAIELLDGDETSLASQALSDTANPDRMELYNEIADLAESWQS